MNIESFVKLKEIDSLNKAKEHQLKLADAQKERLIKIQHKESETFNFLDHQKKLLVQTQSELYEIESSITNMTKQKNNLLSIGGDEKKIQNYLFQISELENLGLDKITQVEKLEKEISEKKVFLEGLKKTVLEIESEVKIEVDQFHLEISRIDLRLKLLKDELSPEFKSTYERISSKNLVHGPFTRIEQGSCYFCRFKISRLDESEIDLQRSLKTCSQCSRIFLPYGA